MNVVAKCTIHHRREDPVAQMTFKQTHLCQQVSFQGSYSDELRSGWKKNTFQSFFNFLFSARNVLLRVVL